MEAARLKAGGEARLKAEDAARFKAEGEARNKAEEAARFQAESGAQLRAEKAARLKELMRRNASNKQGDIIWCREARLKA